MDNTTLITKLISYGADIEGIKRRFVGNFDLYNSCFQRSLQDENFGLLDKALNEKDYQKAFEAAHALKGLTGNLGLQPMYKAVCTLVESLRAKEYSTVDAELCQINEQYALLTSILSDTQEG